MVDAERLEEMRRDADKLREDLERRVAEDPLLDLPVTRSAPPVVYKTRDNGNGLDNSGPAPASAPISEDEDEITDAVMALQDAALDMQRAQDALSQRVAVLEGKIETLLAVLGSPDSTRSRTARKKQ